MEGQQNQSLQPGDQQVDEDMIIKIKFADLQNKQNHGGRPQIPYPKQVDSTKQPDQQQFSQENLQNVSNYQSKRLNSDPKISTENFKNLNVNQQQQQQQQQEDEEDMNYDNIEFEEDNNGEEDSNQKINKKYDSLTKDEINEDESRELRDINQSEEANNLEKNSSQMEDDDDENLFDGDDDISSLEEDLQSSSSSDSMNDEEDDNDADDDDDNDNKNDDRMINEDINRTAQEDITNGSQIMMVGGGLQSEESKINNTNQEILEQKQEGLNTDQNNIDQQAQQQMLFQDKNQNNNNNLNQGAGEGNINAPNISINIEGGGVGGNIIDNQQINKQISNNTNNNSKFFNRRGGRPLKKVKLNDGQQEIVPGQNENKQQQNDDEEQKNDGKDESKNNQDEKKLTKHQFYKYKKLQSKQQNVKEDFTTKILTMTQDEMIKLSFESAARFNDKLLSDKLKLTQLFKKNEQEYLGYRTNIDNEKSFQNNQIPLLIYDNINNKVLYNLNNSMQIQKGTITEFINLNVNNENNDQLNDNENKMFMNYTSRNIRKRRRRRTNAQILADMQKSDD